MIEVFFADIEKLKQNHDICLKLLTPKRRKKAESYYFLDDKLRCIAGGMLMKEVLDIQTDEQIIEGPYGKPRLKKGTTHFNLSHGGNYTVLAVDLLPVGVDIERIDNVDMAVAQKCLQKCELDYLTNGCGRYNENFFFFLDIKGKPDESNRFGLQS